MKIEIWSDYACPFCYVAKRHFEQALAQFAVRDDIEIVHKSFRLDPNAGEMPTYSMKEKLIKVYGKTEQGAVEMMDYINQAGKAAGVVMNIENTQNINTLDAHRLLKFAQSKGLEEEMNTRLYLAYFSESQNLAQHDVLLALAEDIGLNRVETEAMLKSDMFRQESLNDELQAKQFGISAVPFFVFDGKYAVSGAQPTAVFLQALTESYQEHQQSEGLSCGIDGCQI